MELVLVSHMDDVLREALVLKEGEELFAPQEECEPSASRRAQERRRRLRSIELTALDPSDTEISLTIVIQRLRIINRFGSGG